jgi:hypothetical protein
MRAVRILLLVVALVAAGCSSDDDEPGAEDRPTTTTTAAPTTSSTTPATTVPFEGTTEASSLPLARDDTALLETVVLGSDAGVDSVAFTFRGLGIPKVDAEYVEEATADGSGDRVEVVGGAILRLRFEPAATHDLRGEVPEPVYEGPARVRGGTTTVTEAVLGGAFEGVVTFFVGVREEAPYRLEAEGGRVMLLVGSP